MEPRSFERGKSMVCSAASLSPQASMEPRSFERGKAGRDNEPSAESTLQWSRVRLNAERAVGGAGLAITAELQWSRVRLNAESRLRSPSRQTVF